MGRLIGDYIHLSYDNYLKYSIDYPDGDPGGQDTLSQAYKLFNDQIRRIKHMAKSRKLTGKTSLKQQLEFELNFFFNPTDQQYLDFFNITESEAKDMQTRIQQIFMNSVDKKALDKALPNWGANDLSAYTVGNGNPIINDSELQSIINNYGAQSTTRARKASMAARLIDLIKYRDKLADQIGSHEIITKINNFQETYNDTIEDLMAEFGGKDRQKLLSDRKSTYLKETAMIRDLNELIQSLKRYSENNMLGLLGEYIPVITQYVLANKANTEVDTLIEDFVRNIKGETIVGNRRSKKMVDSSKFIGASKKREVANFYGIKSSVSNTQDKVDVYLEFDGQKIPASVKNVSVAATDIHILSGSSILKYIQDYPDFSNHYLNITATHEDRDPNANIIYLANEATKLTIALSALRGGLLAKDADGNFIRGELAQIFVVNTHGTGQGAYKVYFIDDIIDNIAKNPAYIQIQDFNNTRQWNNQYVVAKEGQSKSQAAYARISKMLAELNKFKLNVSISKSALI